MQKTKHGVHELLTQKVNVFSKLSVRIIANVLSDSKLTYWSDNRWKKPDLDFLSLRELEPSTRISKT